MTCRLHTLDGQFVREEKYTVPEDFTGIVKDSLFGSVHYYKNGLLHRENGPAADHSNGKKYWLIKGRQHRLDGPAVEWDEKGYYVWIINNDQINCNSNKQFLLLVDLMKLKGLI